MYLCISTSLESLLPRVNYVTSPTWKCWPNFWNEFLLKVPFPIDCSQGIGVGLLFHSFSSYLQRAHLERESLCGDLELRCSTEFRVWLVSVRAKSHNHLVKKNKAMKIGPFPLPCQSLSKCFFSAICWG